ncbi:glycosyltransferase [Paeniglutamicibacter sp. Y32M11]|uniref:glycosyltransferase n=1 Tax=Paeniglutamicibacter sp. Y32M11 TaxID=2853258 RepID=UPI001C5298D1|nr:glycosyltransferase [Paeniglutamicibacter sp. Y32M11]QXQ09640.1 glycosyltransferase [Paeniglutamicibacter sp. Y32M11]
MDNSPNQISASPNYKATVLHVSEAMGGGVHTAVSSWARVTPEIRHIVLAKRRAGQSTSEWPTNVWPLEIDGSLLDLFKSAKSMYKLTRPSAIHFHSSLAGLFRFSNFSGSKVIYSPHCFAFERTDVSILKRKIFRRIEILLANRSTFGAVSPHEIELARKLSHRAKIELIPNFAEIEFIRKLNTRSRRKIVTVGRICAQKDPKFFSEVVRNLPSDIEVIWVGDGDLESKKELESVGVTVTGWVDMKTVHSVVESAGVYVHTAAWEGSPLATLEAVACGTPVISRNVPSMQSVGYYTPSMNPTGITESIIRYFDDDSYAEEIRLISENVLEENSAANAASALRGLYGFGMNQATKDYHATS